MAGVITAKQTFTNNNTSQTLRGAQNPSVSEAIKYGQEQHKLYNPGSTYKLNRQIPGTFLRPDALDAGNKVIRELKPDNQQAINRGLSQLQKYIDAADSALGKGFTGVIDTYKKR